MEEARNAFHSVDPSISDMLCDLYVSRGFGLSIEQTKQGAKIAKEELLKNLHGGSIRRTSMK